MGNRNTKYKLDSERNEFQPVRTLSYTNVNLFEQNEFESDTLEGSICSEYDDQPDNAISKSSLAEITGAGQRSNEVDRPFSAEVTVTNTSETIDEEQRNTSQSKHNAQADNTRRKLPLPEVVYVNTAAEHSRDKPHILLHRSHLVEGTHINNTDQTHRDGPDNEIDKASSSDTSCKHVVRNEHLEDTVCNPSDDIASVSEQYYYLPDEDPIQAVEGKEEVEEDYEEIPVTEFNQGNNRSSVLSVHSIDSAYSDKSSASVSSIEFMLETFHDRVVESVQVQDITPYLTCIDECDKISIETMGRHDPVNAMRVLLESLKKNQTPGKWQNFLDALLQAEYKNIVQLLKGESDKTYDEHRELIRILTPQLVNRIYSEELIDKLFEKGVISEADKDAIQRQEGLREAAHLLLRRMTTKLPNWFEVFLHVCKECHLDDIIEIFDLTDLKELAPVDAPVETSHGAPLKLKPLAAIRQSNSTNPLTPPPLPTRRYLYDQSQELKLDEYKPPLPDTLPPKRKPSLNQSHTSLEHNSKEEVQFCQRPGLADDEELYVEDCDLQSSRPDHVVKLKQRRALLEKRLEEEKVKSKLRREIQHLQIQLDEIIGSDHTQVNVNIGIYPSTSKPNSTQTDHQLYRKEGQSLEQTDGARDNSTSEKTNTDLYARKDRLELQLMEREQTQKINNLSKKLEALERNMRESNKEQQNYEETDTMATEEIPESTTYETFPDSAGRGTDCDSDPNYEKADVSDNENSNDDHPVPQAVMNELNRLKEELKSHFSEEIKKLQDSNLYGYTDGYRTIHQNNQMQLYSVQPSSIYRGMQSPMGGLFSPLPLEFSQGYGYSNWSFLEGEH